MYLGGHIVEVAGLSPDITEKEVMEFFSYCGEIERLETIRVSEHTSNAYVSFKDAYALKTAICLSGARIGDRCVSISAIEAQIDESDAGSDDTLKAEKGSSSGETNTNQLSSSPPGEAATMEQVVNTMISKGFELSKDALTKAKQLDEEYHISSAAAAKAADLSKRTGLTDKINSGMEAAKSVDEKYNVSAITMSVASFTGKAAVATANAAINTRCFGKGALWVSGQFNWKMKGAAAGHSAFTVGQNIILFRGWNANSVSYEVVVAIRGEPARLSSVISADQKEVGPPETCTTFGSYIGSLILINLKFSPNFLLRPTTYSVSTKESIILMKMIERVKLILKIIISHIFFYIYNSI